MSRKRKKSKAVPVVLVVALLAAALAVGCFLVRPLITDPLRKASRDDLAKRQAEVESQNAAIQAEYEATIRDLQNQHSVQPSNPSWPEHKSEGWDVIDLSNIPLENQTAVDPNMPLRVLGYEGGDYRWQLTQKGPCRSRGKSRKTRSRRG